MIVTLFWFYNSKLEVGCDCYLHCLCALESLLQLWVCGRKPLHYLKLMDSLLHSSFPVLEGGRGQYHRLEYYNTIV